jgi:hypothetical protein
VISPELRDFAESPPAYVTLGAGYWRFETERYSLLLGFVPGSTGVYRVRCRPGELPETLAEVRGLVSEHGHRDATWWLSDETLSEGLRALGLTDDPGGPVVTAMAATEPPEPGPADVVARPVETLEEYTNVRQINWEVFDVSEDDREEERAQLAERSQADRESGAAVPFLAWVDGRPAASALGFYGPQGGFLAAGATLPWARGRGAYRALVRARWDEAVRRGTPALVVTCGEMSGPILRRLGFEDICLLRRLVDAP